MSNTTNTLQPLPASALMSANAWRMFEDVACASDRQ
jgi:hypothetical protein